MALTKAQQRILSALAHGGQIWSVASEEKINAEPFALLAHFQGQEWFGTEIIQHRTLVSLVCLGKIAGDINDYNSLHLA